MKNFKEWLLNEEVETMHADIPMPPEILLLNKIFKAHNKKLYAVGGAVRDFLINKFHHPNEKYSPKDVDITTDAKPDEITKILNSQEAQLNNIKSIPKGEAFGVISAIINGQEFEIATFRDDYYDPITGNGRRPDKVEFSTPEKDAQRRDLTINALFYDIDKKEIIDYNNGIGLQDIKNLVARPVGNPELRFQEDKLRILRLIRFFSRFNPDFIINHLDQNTKNAIEKFKTLSGVSPERTSAEFISGFKSARNKTNFLRNYQDLDLFKSTLPQLNVDLTNYKNSPSFPATFAFILRNNNPKITRNTLNNLKYPNLITDKVELLLSLNNLNNLNIIPLIKRKSVLPNMEEDIIEFAKLTNNNQIQKFAHYQQQTNSQDFMHLKGPEISKAMNQKEKEMFDKL